MVPLDVVDKAYRSRDIGWGCILTAIGRGADFCILRTGRGEVKSDFRQVNAS